MLRKDWKFPYPARTLAAAETRLAYHDDRIRFWTVKRAEVMTTIRAEGIEVDERIALSHPSPKSRDWERGAKIMVGNDLRDDLDECLEKLRWHTEQRRDYDGWLQALQANGDQTVELDIEDWLHFFGRN